MQNAQYDGRMSAFYSKYLVEALVQSALDAKRGVLGAGRRTETQSHARPLSLEQFRELAMAQEARVQTMLGHKAVRRFERPS